MPENRRIFFSRDTKIPVFSGLFVITVRNEVAKVMFSQACVHRGEGAWSWGGSAPGGVGIPACTEADPLGADTPRTRHPPRERRLLLRTVRILLECILVLSYVEYIKVLCDIDRVADEWFWCRRLMEVVHPAFFHPRIASRSVGQAFYIVQGVREHSPLTREALKR